MHPFHYEIRIVILLTGVENYAEIKPVSYFSQQLCSISEICHKEGETVFPTKNG